MFSVVGIKNVHSFSFEKFEELNMRIEIWRAGSLFEEINASKISPTFDRCLSSWVRRKICACRTNSVVQTFLRSFLNNAAGWARSFSAPERGEIWPLFKDLAREDPVCFQSNSDLNLHFA